jgi:hypothetical protein
MNLRGAVKLRQLKMDAVRGTDLSANAALLTEHLEVRSLSVDQTHDLGRAPSDAYAAAVALERIDYWKHTLTLLDYLFAVSIVLGPLPYSDVHRGGSAFDV